jgi:hypothetical protein
LDLGQTLLEVVTSAGRGVRMDGNAGLLDVSPASLNIWIETETNVDSNITLI